MQPHVAFHNLCQYLQHQHLFVFSYRNTTMVNIVDTDKVLGKDFLLINVHFWKPRDSDIKWTIDYTITTIRAITIAAIEQWCLFTDEQKTRVSLPIFILMHHTTVRLPYFFSKKSPTGQKILTCITTFEMLY